ncbi:MAG TPA: DUF1553 domain-containing protein, partial [Alphaproteobacteria bacterium]|nr:DUF1553 domain-containing protein [Alphaproteobacteria bacterium]
SVSPYQPPGLWKEVAYGEKFTAQEYKQHHGPDLYRRSMYTFWKRQSPPPSMMVFDTPNREVCTARRSRTNTPLQALDLMNDPQYVEASRALAERMMKEGGKTPDQRVSYAFCLATARQPSAKEKDILLNVYHAQLKEYEQDTNEAKALISVGDSKPDPKLDVSELAAYSTVASMILNLDETITKS